MNPLPSNPFLAVGYERSLTQALCSKKTPLEQNLPKPSGDGEYHLFGDTVPTNPIPLPLPGCLPTEEVLQRVVGNRLWIAPRPCPYRHPLPGFPSDKILKLVMDSLSSSST
ncbi:hypothetical protein cpL1_0811 [Chlamydia pecorum]|uniref:Uncharacterized protein n=1 Tax=Chlamydia pecorum TaxID=85991 RepID=A0AA40PQ29_9CHLA|nr:hypothetical protein [Chlamydia pecorum]KTF28775.1 hypothetical protein cpL1_0811 [Chlamydia pecorum]KZN26798.1 hypothetical protein cpL17_0938 [Chlamydia pecorum]